MGPGGDSDSEQKQDGLGIGELGRQAEHQQADENDAIVARRAKIERPRCHYCGCPATGWDFFGAPVCDDCR